VTQSARATHPNLVTRPLRLKELPAALEFCRNAGAEGVLAGARLADWLAGRLPSGEAWAMVHEGRWPGVAKTHQIEALCWRGANLMPVGADPGQMADFARLAVKRGGRPASIVGPVEVVLALWDHLRADWGQPRRVFAGQLLMELVGPPLILPDPWVKVATTDQLEEVAFAAVAMFTEELGFPPPDPGGAYRRHVAHLVDQGAVYVRTGMDGQSIEFKADLGAVLADQAQIQGVWTRPDRRGQGLAKAGMAAVVQAAGGRGIKAVSLYVNEFNRAAVAAYHAVGFRQIGTFATVMF